jgi:hypothetical protein
MRAFCCPDWQCAVISDPLPIDCRHAVGLSHLLPLLLSEKLILVVIAPGSLLALFRAGFVALCLKNEQLRTATL